MIVDGRHKNSGMPIKTYSKIGWHNYSDSRRCQREDIKAAIELGYPSDVIEALKNEPNEFKRSQILTTARHDAIEKSRSLSLK